MTKNIFIEQHHKFAVSCVDVVVCSQKETEITEQIFLSKQQT
jgi:hypothetical protein